MDDTKPTTYQKTLRINLDTGRHGTFAEIGAGQEVARWFFHVGGAAGTVAKTVSAYDMAVSDALYGPAERYVSQSRLLSMLEHEYRALDAMLGAKRGADTAFFAFADTMATRSYGRHQDGHGWMGIRFQHAPGSPLSEIVLHVWMLDRDNVREQEAIGILGVNLVHGACYQRNDPRALTAALVDGLGRERVEIDMLRLSGPCFEGVDNRLTSLDLVEQDLTRAAMFTADGEVRQPSEVLYGKPVLVERGSFRPVTNATLDVLRRARSAFDPNAVALMEMTFDNLAEDGQRVDREDFLFRADMLHAVGEDVLISRYGPFHALSRFLRRHTKGPIAFAMGARSVPALFRDEYYSDLGGGVLEGLGRLFDGDVRIYVYPSRDAGSASTLTLAGIEVPSSAWHLYRHLVDGGRLVDLGEPEGGAVDPFPREVQAMIARGDTAWESMVPPEVARTIKERRYLGWAGEGPAG